MSIKFGKSEKNEAFLLCLSCIYWTSESSSWGSETFFRIIPSKKWRWKLNLKIFYLCTPDETMDLGNGRGWRLKHKQKSWWMGQAASSWPCSGVTPRDPTQVGAPWSAWCHLERIYFIWSNIFNIFSFQHAINIRNYPWYILYSLFSFKSSKSGVRFTLTVHFNLDQSHFQVLSGLWLVAVVLDSTGLELTRKSQDIQGIQGTEKRVQ